MLLLSTKYRLNLITSFSIAIITSAFQNQHVGVTCRRRLTIVPQAGVSSSSSSENAIKNKQQDDELLVNMKQEIEELRAEALKRVEALSRAAERVEEEVLVANKDKNTTKQLVTAEPPDINAPREILPEEIVGNKQARIVEEMWEQNPPHSAVDATSTSGSTKGSTNEPTSPLGKPMPMQVEKKNDLDLLDHTHWKVMLDIGRDPGTWMPKDWGISGNRMLLNLELCFENDQLYERDDFLEGVGSAKVCRVVHHELNIAPTMTEGIKKIILKDGGWRIVTGAGPLGTDLLRFFIETDTEIREGDVYVPPGKIYCTCGYFLMHRPSGIKDFLLEKMSETEERIEKIREELTEEGIFSLNRVKLSKELFDLGWKEAELKKSMKEAAVVEPDKSFLRISKKGDVGLTREGGVCCKIKKGPIVEYHILGRFSVAAIEPRE